MAAKDERFLLKAIENHLNLRYNTLDFENRGYAMRKTKSQKSGGQMGLLLVLIEAVALSADAFAVSVCKGLSMRRVDTASALLCGLWFGGFQGLMPFLGYLLGVTQA